MQLRIFCYLKVIQEINHVSRKKLSLFRSAMSKEMIIT